MIQGEEYLGFVCRECLGGMGGIRPVLKPRSQGASMMVVTAFEELMFGVMAEVAQKEDGIMAGVSDKPYLECERCGSSEDVCEIPIRATMRAIGCHSLPVTDQAFLCRGCITEIRKVTSGVEEGWFRMIYARAINNIPSGTRDGAVTEKDLFENTSERFWAAIYHALMGPRDKSTGSAETKNTPDEVLDELQKKEEQEKGGDTDGK